MKSSLLKELECLLPEYSAAALELARFVEQQREGISDLAKSPIRKDHRQLLKRLGEALNGVLGVFGDTPDEAFLARLDSEARRLRPSRVREVNSLDLIAQLKWLSEVSARMLAETSRAGRKETPGRTFVEEHVLIVFLHHEVPLGRVGRSTSLYWPVLGAIYFHLGWATGRRQSREEFDRLTQQRYALWCRRERFWDAESGDE